MQAWRKPGLQPVAKAFLRGGLTAAYEAFEALPHTEAEYDKRFAYNTDVTRICYKDDAGCVGIRAGHVADNEKSLWVITFSLVSKCNNWKCHKTLNFYAVVRAMSSNPRSTGAVAYCATELVPRTT